MMKSITVTTHRAFNYGAVLQSYALQTAQKQLGVENFLLDYESSEWVFEKFPAKLNRSFIITLVCNICSCFYYKKVVRRLERFQSFICNYINVTDVYKTEEDVVSNPPSADFYLTGSDQVFTVRGEQTQRRFLQFGSENIPRFSYAASLGEYDWDTEEENYVQTLLQSFNHISVREQYAAESLSTLKINSTVNIDPVFLLDRNDWAELAVTPDFEGEYILCYALLSNSNMQTVLDKLKKKYKLPVICIQTNCVKRLNVDRYVFDAGPREFLGLLKNASIVVTTSFHGTAFASIFNKPFYTLVKSYKPKRITDLMDLFHLSDRVIWDTDCIGDVTDTIDFSYTNSQIKKEQNRSIKYLKDIIKYIKGRNVDNGTV